MPASDGAYRSAVPGLADTADSELLAQVRRIEIRARRLATMLLAGDYRSVFRGAGIEFAEAREYAVGDDVRLIDWNVTARMGAPWVKQYVEERELPVVCAVDVSASQSVAKSAAGRTVVAAEVAALLSFAAVYQHDRAALLTFTDQVERFVPPARGTKHVLRIVREILRGRRASSGTSITAACEYLARVLRRRSIVFLISDFLDEGYEPSLRTLADRHEVIAISLVDLNDLELPDLGIVEIEDAERGTRAFVDTGDRAVRRRFAAFAAERARGRRATLASAGVDELVVRLDEDPVKPLVAYFRTRAARR
jgi:uncharacterized protein (DUF58 family)